MRTVAKCAAIASVVLLTAGSAAWAQGYGNSSGNYINPGYNPGYNQGFNPGYNQSHNPGYQDGNGGRGNQGNWYNNQGAWGQGTQGSSGQYSENSAAGYGNNLNYGFAQRQLSEFGYTDIHNLRPTQGWSADAMKNGRMVHVVISDNGMIATFRGE